MKRFILLLLLVTAVPVCGQSASDFIGPDRQFIGSDNANLNPLYLWALEM